MARLVSIPAASGRRRVRTPCTVLRLLALAAFVPISVSAVAVPAPAESEPSHGLLVPGGTASLLQAAGVRVPVERDRALLVLVRHLHAGRSEPAAIAARIAGAAGQRGDTERVPGLLPLHVWRQAVFGSDVPAEALVASLLQDRQASFLYHGLFALDSESLAFFAANAGLVSTVHKRSAAAFAAYSEGLRIRGGRVEVAGGPAAELAWERALGVSGADAAGFAAALLERDEGRLAQLFDALGRLDPAHLAFALGPSGRGLPALIAAAAGFDARVQLPFTSWSDVDVPFLLEQVQVTPDGRMAPPRDRAFWEAVLAGESAPPAGAGPPEDVTAAWLVERFAALPAAQRRQRLDALLFAQRRAAAGGAEAGTGKEWLEPVASFPSWQTLFLTLEQMGSTAPDDYRAAARAGAVVASGYGPPEASRRLAVFQAAVALVARMARVGTVSAAGALELVRDLFGRAAFDRLRYPGSFVDWIEQSVFTRLPASVPGATAESRLLDALAGPGAGEPAPGIEWEGHRFTVDLAGAERQRLEHVREGQGGRTLDDAIALRRAVVRISDPGTEPEGLREAAGHVYQSANGSAEVEEEWLFGYRVDGLLGDMLELAEAAEKQPDRLRSQAARHRLAAGLEAVLADVLVAHVYALVTDPDAPMVPGDGPSRRHDFGLADRAASTPWRLAELKAGRGTRGSLLGLDRSLARQSLRPTMMGLPPRPPTLTLEDVTGLAESVTALNPFRLTDEGRDLLAAALRRGRSRLAAAAHRPGELDALLAAAGVDGIRRRLAGLATTQAGSLVHDYVALSEVLRLGQDPGAGISDAVLNNWGAAARLIDGSLGLRMPGRLAWRERTGRPGSGLVSAHVADLQLRVAEWLAERRLPASLAPGVLAFAMWDLTMTAQVANADDWLPVVRAAQAVSSQRLEDYVSALAAGGPLVPEGSKPRG